MYSTWFKVLCIGNKKCWPQKGILHLLQNGSGPPFLCTYAHTQCSLSRCTDCMFVTGSWLCLSYVVMCSGNAFFIRSSVWLGSAMVGYSCSYTSWESGRQVSGVTFRRFGPIHGSLQCHYRGALDTPDNGLSDSRSP